MPQQRSKRSCPKKEEDNPAIDTPTLTQEPVHRDTRMEQNYYITDCPPPAWDPVTTVSHLGPPMPPYYTNGQFPYVPQPQPGFTRVYTGFSYPREPFIPPYSYSNMLPNFIPPSPPGSGPSISTPSGVNKRDRRNSERGLKHFICPVPGCFMLYLQEKHLNLHLIGHQYDKKTDCTCLACMNWERRREMFYAPEPQFAPPPCFCPKCVAQFQPQGPPSDTINEQR